MIFIYIQLIHFTVQQKLMQHCKVTELKETKNAFPGGTTPGVSRRQSGCQQDKFLKLDYPIQFHPHWEMRTQRPQSG